MKISTIIIFLLVFSYCLLAQNDWQIQNSGTTNQLNAVYFIDEFTGWVVGNSGTILKTTDGGNNWFAVTCNTLESLNDVCFIDAEYGWACASSGRVFKAVSSGTNWIEQSTGASTTTYRALHFTTNLVGYTVGEPARIALTIDGGNSWTFQTCAAWASLNDINFDVSYAWIAGDGGKIFNTSDGGLNWLPVATGVYNDLNSLHFHNSNGIVVGDAGLVLKTTNAGASFSSQYLNPADFNDICFPCNNHTGWIVGDFGKVFATTDFGENWQLQTTQTIRDLNAVFFINEQKGWAVGDYGTIIHTNNCGGLTEINSGKPENTLTQYSLFENYPNPFNPGTTISFKIPESTEVRLQIYDVRGRKIATLVNRQLAAGTHEVRWNAAGQVSGIYFCRLIAGKFVTTRKMLLAR